MEKNYESRIRALLEKMTLSEKVGQLQQCGPSLVGAFNVSFDELLNMMFGDAWGFQYFPFSSSVLFILSTICDGLAVISTHAGMNPLFTAFLTDLIFDQAEQ